MSIFRKDALEKAAEAFRASQRKVEEFTDKSRQAVKELDDGCEAERRAEEENERRALAGEALINIDRSRVGRFQRNEDAMSGALARAMSDRDRALEAYTQAQEADRVSRLNAKMRSIVAVGETLRKEGAELQAIYEEDPKNLTTAEFQIAGVYVGEWIGRAELHLNPPPPPAPDPNMVLVRFIKSFNGRAEHPTHKRILAYGEDETASFDRAQAALLFELGVAEPFNMPAPEEVPGAPVHVLDEVNS